MYERDGFLAAVRTDLRNGKASGPGAVRRILPDRFSESAKPLRHESACRRNGARREEKGLRTILATNPIFPRNAVESRIRWAGLEPEDFEWITTYENSFFCKPDPRYYLKIAETAGTDPSECLMIGNDVSDDGAAEKAGMAVFILTDCLISRGSGGLSGYPHGGFEELNKYIERQTERKGITV